MTPLRLHAVYCEGARSLRLDTPSGAVGVRPGGDHPLLGEVDEICSGAFDPLTVVGRIDWRDPDRIPPVLEPARLPPGAGTGLLNTIARSARGPLRYRGPYPTAALYGSLNTCFRPSAPLEAFTAGVEQAAVDGREVEPEVWFEPAPFERYRSGAITVEVKDEVVAAIYVGVARFERDRPYGRVLVDRDGASAARFAVPGCAPIELAVADATGRVLAASPELPAIAGPHLGRALPEPVSAAIYAAAAARAPELLRAAVASLARRPIVWGDTGLALASIAGDRVAVHGRLATGDLEPTALMAVLIDAAAPVALRLAQRELAEAAT